MSLLKMMARDSGLMRQVSIGDLLGASETLTALATAGAGALTGALLANNIINRTGPGGAVADTLDTAPNIIAAVPGAATGDSWRIRYINTVAFAITWTGVTGVTVTNGIVNASSVKEFLVVLTNATPQSIATGSTTNASAVVTGMTAAQTALITPGQLITGTGITGGTKVLSVQPGIGVTLDANATATNALVALTFNPVVTVTGLGQGLL
jgi:hypothetical protein